MGKIIETRNLYKNTVNEVTKSIENWTSFLDSSAWNFKYDFDDQILIYAQRPEAKACAEIEEWNKKLKRWIKRGSKGIFVFAKDENSQYPFRIVFDISDTYNSNHTEFKLWSIKPEYEKDIIETLENNFGDLTDTAREKLSYAINVTGDNIVNDNIQDYLEDIKKYKDQLQIEGMPDNFFEDMVRVTVMASVSYMVMTRCGLDPKENMSIQDFQFIKYFKSYECATIIGNAVSDIAEMELRAIARTITELQKSEKNKNHTFEKNENEMYDKNIENNKEEKANEREYRIQANGRLYDTKSSDGERGDSKWKIRQNEIQLPKEPQESRIDNLKYGAEIKSALERNTRNSNNQSGTNSERNGSEGERDRGIESERPIEVGWTYEQLENNSRGNGSQRDNSSLGSYRKENDIGYVVVDEKINQILAKTQYLAKYNKEIIEYFEDEKDIAKRAEFLKSIFNTEYTEIIVDDMRFGYKTFDNGVLFWKDAFLSRTAEILVSWENLTYHYDSMILLHQLKDMINKPKSIDEQTQIINTKETIPVADFEFTQEFIDQYLQEQHQATKFTIYNFFEKSLSDKENAELLKRIYGISGSNYTIKGSGIGYNTDSNGITFQRGYLDKSAREQLFNWNYIQKRINELIKQDRYFSAKDKEDYPKWQEQQEQDRMLKDAEERLANIEDKYELETEIVTPQELPLPLRTEETHYEYHLGDTVYIGADEYEINAINNDTVVLYNPKFPLFTESMDFKEFERKVKENPANDGLKVKNTKENIIEEPKEITAPKETEEILEDKISDINNPIDTIKKSYKVGDIEQNIKPNFVRQSNKIQSFILHPEVAEIDKHNYKITDNELGVGTPREKFARNIEAIKVLKKCEDENRYATKEEQEILSKYVGWGGLPQAFDEKDSSWANEYKELKNILNDEEYKQARSSTLTAFYTPPIVINAIYQAVQNMGLKQANILEPSCRCWKFFRNVT